MNTPIILPSAKDKIAGQLLIAAPQIQDDFFRRSVIYMCSHNEEGGMGIIINTPIEKITLNEILEQMQSTARAGDRKMPVLFGGPVESYRGFLMHNGDYEAEGAISNFDGITVTPNSAVLTGWLQGDFGAKLSLALGYAGWSPGQLESEIETGSWMVSPATEPLLFDLPRELVWEQAIASLGFDVGNLSSTVGHA